MSRITITDHAVIRYLERVKGIDISAVRDEMRSAGLEAAITMGAETLKLGNGCRLRIVNETSPNTRETCGSRIAMSHGMAGAAAGRATP
jgi:hypothetical protein